MALSYGFVKCKVISDPVLKSSRHKREIQYHLHAKLSVPAADGTLQTWETAVNVGTNDSDDLLRYKVVLDYHDPILDPLKAAAAGFTDLSTAKALPALDFLRTTMLAETGKWRDSDVMDGSDTAEPVASLKKLLTRAHSSNADVYIFGRTFKDGSLGIHDVHMNQGSSGGFVNSGDDHNDHNDTFPDGGVIVDFGESECSAYFTAFTQQMVPTDDLGNPADDGHGMDTADDGSLAG